MPKKYKVVDFYEDYEIIGRFDTLTDAVKAANDRVADTDGECDVTIFRWSEIYHTYRSMRKELES